MFKSSRILIPILIAALPFQISCSGNRVTELTDSDANAKRQAFHEALHAGDTGGVKSLIPGLSKNDINLKFENRIDKFKLSPLHFSLKFGLTDIAMLLIDAGADVNELDVSGYTPLQLVAASTLLNSAMRGKKINFEAYDEKYEKPLPVPEFDDKLPEIQFNSFAELAEVASMLLEAGAEVDKKGDRWGTPLSIAFPIKDSDDLVNILVQNGAELNHVTSDGYAGLHYFAGANTPEKARMFIDAGADLEVRNKDGKTPLFIAAAEGHEIIASELISAGADVNANPESLGIPILHAAVFGKNVDIVKLLLENGADLEIRMNTGITALFSAAFEGYTAVAREFIKAGADVNSKSENKFGTSILHAAAMENNVEIVNLLLKNGANLEIRDNLGETPLDYAIRDGRLESVRILLASGANIHTRDLLGATPLTRAIAGKHNTIVKVLIRAGADVNAIVVNGFSMLHVAAISGNLEMVRELLNDGANVNAKDDSGLIPLSYAAGRHYNGKVLEVLLKAGSDVHSKDNHNFSPLDHAQKYNRADAIRLLKENGALERKT